MAWYIHHMTVNGAAWGFVDEDNYIGTSPDGGPEKISGPYDSKDEAEGQLKRMIAEDRRRRDVVQLTEGKTTVPVSRTGTVSLAGVSAPSPEKVDQIVPASLSGMVSLGSKDTAPLARTFRVFLSSTFSDLKAERDALQREVFPRLRELCRAHGCRFQAIDLRWGISQEAGLDHRTMRVCLEEIERCQRETPRPNFLVLLGDRYGWRPLPEEIPTDEFERLSERLTPEERSLLGGEENAEGWYRRDGNAVPPVYCLRPRGGIFAGYAAWERLVERPLQNALCRAAEEAGLQGAARARYTASATEQEIWRGALDVPDAAEHVFCFFRQTTGLPDDARAGPFLDSDETGRRDDEATRRLADLKDTLRRRLPGQVRDYQAT
jgi:Domain of unknown function (DUF4062)